MIDYPLKASKCETLAQSILRFSSGATASLYCHFNRTPMTNMPFFQIFGDKVGFLNIQLSTPNPTCQSFQGEITIGGGFDGGVSYRNMSHPKGAELGSLGGFSAAFTPQMREFVAQIVGGESGGQDSVQQALGEVMVAQAIYKSTKTKQWETVSLENLTAS